MRVALVVGGLVGAFGCGGGGSDPAPAPAPAPLRPPVVRYDAPPTVQMSAGNGSMANHTPAVPTIALGAPQLLGGHLDKAIVRRSLKHAIAPLQRCYETALATHPDLAGTVTASFTITGEGTVQKASATGVAREVSDCVARVIGAITFPAPQDGLAVDATVPLHMRRAGS